MASFLRWLLYTCLLIRMSGATTGAQSITTKTTTTFTNEVTPNTTFPYNTDTKEYGKKLCSKFVPNVGLITVK